MIPLLLTATACTFLYIQIRAICNYRMNRFVFDYASAVCNAYYTGLSLKNAQLSADYLFHRTHPKLFKRFKNSNHFRKKANHRVDQICTEWYTLGVSELPTVLN